MLLSNVRSYLAIIRHHTSQITGCNAMKLIPPMT